MGISGTFQGVNSLCLFRLAAISPLCLVLNSPARLRVPLAPSLGIFRKRGDSWPLISISTPTPHPIPFGFIYLPQPWTSGIAAARLVHNTSEVDLLKA